MPASTAGRADQQQGPCPLFLQLLQQVEDLRLIVTSSAVGRLVGDQEVGLRGSVIAIITRCFWPPSSGTGTRRCAVGLGDADLAQPIDRLRARRLPRKAVCASIASTIWLPTRSPGQAGRRSGRSCRCARRAPPACRTRAVRAVLAFEHTMMVVM